MRMRAADEARLDVAQPHIIGPLVGDHLDGVRAPIIRAIDQHAVTPEERISATVIFSGFVIYKTHRCDLFQPTKVMMMVAQSIARLARPYPTARSGCDMGEENSTATNGVAVMANSTRPVQNSPLILEAVAVIRVLISY
jgi:hypothetical protein